MRNQLVVITLFLFISTWGAVTAQAQSDKDADPKADPKDEEVIAVLDILELMEMLDDMDLIKDMEYLTEGDPNESQD